MVRTVQEGGGDESGRSISSDEYSFDRDDSNLMVEEVELEMENIMEIRSSDCSSPKNTFQPEKTKKIVCTNDEQRTQLPAFELLDAPGDDSQCIFSEVLSLTDDAEATTLDARYSSGSCALSEPTHRRPFSSVVHPPVDLADLPAPASASCDRSPSIRSCSRINQPSMRSAAGFNSSESPSPVYSVSSLADQPKEPPLRLASDSNRSLSPALTVDSYSSNEDGENDDPRGRFVIVGAVSPADQKRPHVCTQCDRRFARRANLKKHAVAHSDRKPLTCTMCRLTFAEKASLRDHILVKHIMRAHFAKPLRPRVTQPDASQPPPCCTHCHRVFADRVQLKRHIVMRHLMPRNDKPLACVHCDRTFLYESMLRTHLMTHEKRKPFACQLCERSFTLKSNLKTHEMIHKNERPFACAACGKSFTRRSNLKTHVMLHKNERPFACPYCGRAFAHRNSLQRHIMLHRGDKPYTCGTCQRSFTHKVGLTVHLMNHSNEKPFVCAQCGSSFTLKSLLRKHMLYHMNVRPYACAHCDRAFTQKSDLKRHSGIHEDEAAMAATATTATTATATPKATAASSGHANTNSVVVELQTRLTPEVDLEDMSKSFSCCYCSRAFARKCDLTKHIYEDQC